MALFIAPEVKANDWYVATNGTPAGPGTLALPFDLTTALSGAVGRPGDTFWLTSGNYTIGHINTTIQGGPGHPITFREAPGEQARVDGSLAFWDSTGNIILRDLEFYSSDTNRFSSETNAGFEPTDITNITGIASYSPNMSFINLIVHDETGEGIYLSQTASNDLIYGCVIYDNGWRSPDDAEGHGIYAQGWNANAQDFPANQDIVDNIVFNNSGACLQIYDNATNYYLIGITLDGNTAFNASAIQNVRLYRDWIVGVDEPSISADQIVFKNNLGYFPPNPSLDDTAQIGLAGINGGVAVLNNYLPQGIELNNWTIAAVSGNTLSSQPNNYAVSLNQSLISLAAAWNDNNYIIPTDSAGFLDGTNTLNFSGWQSDSGFDLDSVSSIGTLAGTQVFLETNEYEAGRANIVAYNWGNLSNVAVNVNPVLSPGAAFEVRNAEDFFGPPVLSGVFTNQMLSLPTTGLTVAVPNGPMLTPPPTGPTFNVFVLLPRMVRLHVEAAKGQAVLFWPTNAGDWVLQSAVDLTTGGAWLDVTDAPVLVGGDKVVTNDIFGDQRFYRLRPGS